MDVESLHEKQGGYRIVCTHSAVKENRLNIFRAAHMGFAAAVFVRDPT